MLRWNEKFICRIVVFRTYNNTLSSDFKNTCLKTLVKICGKDICICLQWKCHCIIHNLKYHDGSNTVTCTGLTIKQNNHVLRVSIQKRVLQLFSYKDYYAFKMRILVVSVLLYACTTKTQHNAYKKDRWKLHNLLHAVLNKSWNLHPTKQQLYSHLPLTSQTIQVRWARHTEHFWRSKNKLIKNFLRWTTTHGYTSDSQPAKTYFDQFRVYTGWHIEDLPRGIVNREWIARCLDDENERLGYIFDNI